MKVKLLTDGGYIGLNVVVGCVYEVERVTFQQDTGMRIFKVNVEQGGENYCLGWLEGHEAVLVAEEK